MLDQDILQEATRLTRAGRLVEATALLQRMLRGQGAGSSAPATQAIPLPAPLIIDVEPNDVDAPEIDPASAPREARRYGPAAMDGDGFAFGPVPSASFVRSAPGETDLAPAGTRFIDCRFGSAEGSRAYKLFIPGNCVEEPRPLVIMLHGCTQSPDDFAAGTRMNFAAQEQGCFVAYPAQPRRANRAKCWNWFRAADQQRGRGEPALIAGITQQIIADHRIDRRRIYVAGLSAGAAAAAVLGRRYGDLYAAVGVHSGLACGVATDLPSALAAMRRGASVRRSTAGDGPLVPTIVFHGDRDTTVHPVNGQQIVEEAAEALALERSVHRGHSPAGHAYTRTMLSHAGRGVVLEHWAVHGAGHAWSGGSPAGSHTDPRGPDATREMLRFFLEHPRSADR